MTAKKIRLPKCTSTVRRSVYLVRWILWPCAAVLASLSMTVGCDTLRFAPSELQKQNAYLHHRTVEAAALQTQLDQASQPLCDLINQATQQSEAIIAYYGLPQQIPPTESLEQILSADNKILARTAYAQSLERPDPWDFANHLLELGIALAGVLGGVYGSRVLATLQLARRKTNALREVVQGNELFKKQNSQFTDVFKKAHQGQSDTTRAIVATLK